MKNLKTFALLSLFFVVSLAVAAPREVKIYTEKKEDGIHWMPESFEVTEGETIKFKVVHEAPGGFDQHGFQIPVLKIEKTVDRTKPLLITQKITLKPGEYEIGCQFHPAHQKSKMVVVAKPAKGGDKTAELTSPAKKPRN